MPFSPWHAAQTLAFSLPAAGSPACATAPTASAAAKTKSFVMVVISFPRSLHVARRVIGGDIRHVLVGEAGGNCAHRRMAALAGLVGLQRFDEIRGVLPAELGHRIHFPATRRPIRQCIR